MHLFLQICGVAGFSIFGASLPDLYRLRSGTALKYSSNEDILSWMCGLAFALISTYFIFG